MKAGIINVGANASHFPLRSPIFEDGSFEFIPIPEPMKIPAKCQHVLTFAELRSFYSAKATMAQYLPPRFLTLRMHNDPDLVGFTYGDYPTQSPRASNLRLLDEGDHLFFLARLVAWRDGNFTEPAGFYLVGYLEIEKVVREVRSRNSFRHSDFDSNAHVLRGLCRKDFWDGFWLFKGSSMSRRFARAVPFTREVASVVLRDRHDQPWRWSRSKSELQTIGSYTRSCRIITNQERIEELWCWANSHD